MVGINIHDLKEEELLAFSRLVKAVINGQILITRH